MQWPAFSTECFRSENDIQTLLNGLFPDISPLPLGTALHPGLLSLRGTASLLPCPYRFEDSSGKMPNPYSCCSLPGERGWHQVTVPLSPSAAATDLWRQCHPRGGFTTCAVWFFWNLREKTMQLFTAGYLPLRDSKQRRCTSPPIIFNGAALMKYSQSFKMHWEVRLQRWPAYMTWNTKAVEVD